MRSREEVQREIAEVQEQLKLPMRMSKCLFLVERVQQLERELQALNTIPKRPITEDHAQTILDQVRELLLSGHTNIRIIQQDPAALLTIRVGGSERYSMKDLAEQIRKLRNAHGQACSQLYASPDDLGAVKEFNRTHKALEDAENWRFVREDQA